MPDRKGCKEWGSQRAGGMPPPALLFCIRRSMAGAEPHVLCLYHKEAKIGQCFLIFFCGILGCS